MSQDTYFVPKWGRVLHHAPGMEPDAAGECAHGVSMEAYCVDCYEYAQMLARRRRSG